MSAFQSPPGLRAGCYVHLMAGLHIPRLVSILTRPEGRVLLSTPRANWSISWVSILTRPEGRVLRTAVAWCAAGAIVSILTRPEGRVLRSPITLVSAIYSVSILTRPEGRVLLSSVAAMSRTLRCFNPHPARRPGATLL